MFPKRFVNCILLYLSPFLCKAWLIIKWPIYSSPKIIPNRIRWGTLHISANALTAWLLFFAPSLPLSGTGLYHLRSSPLPVVLDQFLLLLKPKSGAPSEQFYAVRCDLVQNPISVFSVGGPTATVGSVEPLIPTSSSSYLLSLGTRLVSEEAVTLN